MVHDVVVDEESPTSSKSDPETDCDIGGETRLSSKSEKKESSRGTPIPSWTGERRRRKLPEIPKNKKCE